jgi:putative oxidoreductase
MLKISSDRTLLLTMFSSFPDEWPGAGLLLLRAATGAGFVAQGVAYLGGKQAPAAITSAVAAFMVIIGALLLIGSLSRWAALLAATTNLLSVLPWFPGPRIGLFETPITTMLAAVIATALVCLGPGAFSVDARLFGRREVIIPKTSVKP